jgi:hypothetical protein
MKRTFDVGVLRALGLPWEADCEPGVVVSHRLVDDPSTWDFTYEVVFRYEDRLYRITYSINEKEIGEESPWEYTDRVEAEEVEAYQELVTVYRPVV